MSNLNVNTYEIVLFLFCFTPYWCEFFNDHDRGSDKYSSIQNTDVIFFVGRWLSQNIMSFLPRQHFWASYPRFAGSIRTFKAPEILNAV